MARLELAILGSYRAALDGKPIETFHYEKARALLAFLVSESDRAHTRSALAGMLWPDKPESVARQNLSQALATLRRVLGESEATGSFFVVTNRQIRFDSESDHACDTAQFTELLDKCEEHDHVRLADCEPCLHGVRQAIALYRGDFLADLVVVDSPEFYEWVLMQQARFQRLVIDALGQLAAAYETRGAYQEALVYAKRRLELAPWQEESHRHAMRLLALDGRRVDALKQFDVCLRTMRAEMDIEPEAETLALYEQIRSGAQIQPAAQGTPHNLQAQLTPLLGRNAELATVTDCLRSAASRLVVLVGPGGSGKSRLAIEAAEHLLADFPDGVHLVPLASLTSAQSLVPAIAQSVGLNLYGGTSPATQLQQYLRTKRMLLVLDNFEHLLDGATQISGLLHATQYLSILVTSRARLKLQPEQAVWIGGLETPAEDTARRGGAQDGKATADYAAVQLFLYQARRSDSQFSPDDKEMASIARICRLVNGMPLSILLAASWADLLEVEEIARRVAGESAGASLAGIDFLESDWRDVAPRQRSMRTVLDNSWQMLDQSGQQLLAKLSVFRGEFTAEAAKEVCGASLRHLKALVDRSLLEPTQAGRYLLHEHLRQYAGERLGGEALEAATVGSLHAAYYMQRLRDGGDALKNSRQLAALSEIASEFENIRAAWLWSIQRADIDKIAGGLDGLSHFLIWKYRLREGRDLYESAANSLRASGTGQRHCVLAEVLICQARFSRLLGNLDEAHSLTAEAQTLVSAAEQSGSDVRRTRAVLLQEMGHITFGSQPLEAETLWRECLALSRELGDTWQIAEVLNDLSTAVAVRAGWDEVGQFSQEALKIQRALGDRRGMARTLHSLCNVADNRGRIDDAIEYIEECIRVSQEIGDQFGVAQSYFFLAIENMYSGKFADAYSIFKTAAEVSGELGAVTLHAWILHFMAWDSVNLGLYGQAEEHDSEALALFSQMNHGDGIAFCGLSTGEYMLGQGDIEAARSWLEKTLQEFRQLGNRDGTCLTLNTLTCTELHAGNLAKARDYISEALSIAADTLDYGPALGAVAAASLLRASCGEAEKAVELYALASGHPYIGKSVWRHQVVGKRVEQSESTLPVHLAADAKQRGQARDLIATVRDLAAEYNR